MQSELQISDDFILPLFDEIFVVKERDFSIEYNPLGSGRQKLLMLVSSVSDEYLDDDSLVFLKTIIEKGLKKTMEDVWIVNLQRFPEKSPDSIWDYFQPNQVIIWGCADWLKTSGVRTDMHQQWNRNGADVLTAAELSFYQKDSTAKTRLWVALQRMFFN